MLNTPKLFYHPTFYILTAFWLHPGYISATFWLHSLYLCSFAIFEELSIYNRKVLFVCVSRKMITLPTSLKSSSLAVFMVIHGSRLVFHGSRSVFVVFHGSRLVFHGSRPVFMVFHGSRLVLHGFSWFFSKMYLPKLYPVPTIQSRSAARRAA